MAKREDLTGHRFGRLTVIEHIPKKDAHATWYLCECDCGTRKEVRSACLKRGDTKSCGCLSKELSGERGRKQLTKHGWYGTRLYSIWHTMVDRCTNPNSSMYKHYGGRGIELCEEWRNNPASFCEWAMANGYNNNLTIDRIDNDKGYEPSNCQWVTNDKQQVNKRNNVFITYQGKTQCVAEWARELGISQHKIYARIKNGWKEAEHILFQGKLKRKDYYYGEY